MEYKIKIFISYAKEDIEVALKLYNDLKQAGIIPWMDCEDMIPGQNWRETIRHAIHDSSFFMTLLSSRSVSKRGFVQKELKIALEILSEFPESDIFIIPVRIDDCTPADEKIEKLHWVDLFPSYDKGFNQILRAFKTQRKSASGISDEILQRPYNFLDAYTEKNSAIFFGREQDISKSLSKIVSHQLLLLYGKSGVGKTSLIRAALIPRLRSSGEYLPVYARILIDPEQAIIKAVSSVSNIRFSDEQSLSLRSVLKQASELTEKTIILFIDQFEALFTDTDAEERLLFIQHIGEIYADNELRTKIVFSFREDFLPELYGLSLYISEIFHNQYRLECLTSNQAKEAILKPALMFGFNYEATLMEHLLADLGGDMIEPPQIQIVCDRLYETLSANEKCFTFLQYEQLGRAGGILSEYLNMVLKRYELENRTIIQSLLKAFVTSAETKAALTIDNVARRTGFQVSRIEDILNELIDARLIRHADSETYYELAHEYLVKHIQVWFSDQERDLIKAQELLEQGLTKWKRFRFPLYPDEMAIIDTHREALNIEGEALSLLVYSSLFSENSMEYWMNRADPEVRQTILKDALESDNPLYRLRAAELIRRFSVNQLKDNIGERMLTDPDADVRHKAAVSLFQMDKDIFISDIVKGLENVAGQRDRSLEIIVYIEDSLSEKLKSDELKRFRLLWPLRWLRLKQNRSARNTYLIHAAMYGSIGAWLGAIIGYLISDIPGRELITAVVLPTSAGLVLSSGIGFGLGTAEAMGEHRFSWFHFLLTSIFGSAPFILYGLTDQDIQGRLITACAACIMGVLFSGTISVIITLTRTKTSSSRFIHRILWGIVIAIFIGTVTAYAIWYGNIIAYINEHGIRVRYDFLYGFFIGFYTFLYMIFGIELAEQKLLKPDKQRNIL